MSRHFILGTAGHIDHGKSSLVNALTGTDPDRLPEEKARGMTIELGFAHLAFPDPENPDTSLELGIVDVPGHADFVRNMVAGVGSIDLALFIVAADDSWMPQSEEHLQILSYLNVKKAVVALTKADLAEDIDFVIEDVRTYLAGTFLENAPIIPTNAPGGEGIDELKAAIASVLRDATAPREYAKPRLPVDRAFSPTGVGTVVTGTLTGGSFKCGDNVIIQPGGLKSRIRTIQNHKHAADQIPPGTRTALNLSDAPIADKSHRNGVRRGSTITLESLGDPCLVVDVHIEKSDREIQGQPGSRKPIRDGQKVRFHHGSSDTGASLFILGEKNLLKPGESAIAELRFEAPVHVFSGDGFVLRDWGKRSTIAGGTVLDPDASTRRFRKPHQKAFLSAVAAAPDDPTNFLGALLTRDQALDTAQLAKSPFSKPELDAALGEIVAAGIAVSRGNKILDASWWDTTVTGAAGIIRAHHAANPDRTSISITGLRAKLDSKLTPALVDQIIADLLASGFVKTPSGIRSADHAPKLPPELAPLRAGILSALAENPIEPPNPKEICPSPNHKQVLRFLMEIGEVVDLGEKCAILATAYDELVEKTKKRLAESPATAADIRTALGTTRRILIPLLEKLDADAITLRNGDLRSLKKTDT
ncbi:MAG: selenocysteine-specific translation elongation factor [Verrucomicrobiales bacterium]|nr:selenocysteine-specific translation elongation factor [Verrucomicrobiales bacterium]